MSDTGLDIGTLSGRIELVDTTFTGTVDLVLHKIDQLDEKFGGLGHHIAEQATAFFTAEAALDAVREAAHLAAETLKEITIEGSHAADIESTFTHLTESAGLFGEELLGHMRDGVRGTVTDLDLMTRVNQNLAVGLNLTTAQMDTLSKGAFVLAKATGGDVSQALDKLSDAMVTGRIRGIQLLTGKIDLTDAEDKYAAKLKVTTDHLSAEGKQHAIQEIILDKVAAATERVGEMQTRLADKVQQAKVDWANFMEELGTSIAESPVVAAGIDSIRDSLAQAFGGTQEEAIRKITKLINESAIDIVGWSKYVVDAVAIAGREWDAFKVVIVTVEQGVRVLTYGFEALLLGLMKVAQFTTGMDLSGPIQAVQKDMDRLYQNMIDGEKAIDGYKQSQEEWAISTGHLDEAIDKIQQKMKDANVETKHSNENASLAAEYQAKWAAETKANTAEQDRQRFTIAQTAEEIKKMREAQEELNSSGKTWHETVAHINPAVAEAVKQYLAAGVSASALATVYHLTSAEVKALELATKDQTEAQKLQQKAMEDSMDRWAEYKALVTSISGSATDQQIADIDRWVQAEIKSHVMAKTDTEDFYNWLTKMSAAQAEKMDHDRLLQDTHSKAFFENVALQAKDAFDFASLHSDQFTTQYIESLRAASDAAALAAVNWDKTVGAELDNLNEKAGKLSQNLSYAFQVTAANWNQAGLTGGGWGAMNDTIMGVAKAEILPYLQKGFSLANAIIAVQAHIPPDKWNGDPGPRVPGFKDGGVGDFGAGTLAVLHGHEAIIPLDKTGGAGMGGVTIHSGAFQFMYPIMNSPRAIDEFGRMISETVLTRLRARGVRT